jgi:teichuronic acid biosynthesis glycosyltransferase TuaC
MNILVLTNLLPAPILPNKIRENDVLLTAAELHEKMDPDVHYTFVFVLQTTLLRHISHKYLDQKRFLAMQQYTCRGRQIEIIEVPTFKYKRGLWPLYMNLGYLYNKKRLGRIIKENHIDVVHAHDLIVDLGIAYNLHKWLKIPYVVTVRHLARVEYLLRHIRRFVSAASAVINISFAGKEEVDAMNNNSYVVPHGIDSRFMSLNKNYTTQKTLKIVTVSRLLFWKNIDILLQALIQIKEGFTYDIYGDGPFLDTLKGIVEGSAIQDKVVFHGHIDYELIPETLEKYDLFVLPSYKEVFGRVYIEAMACGLPVIGAKTTGMDGYITEGEQGFLVDHTNVIDLQHTIQRFIDDESLKVSMGKKAKEFSMKFSWDAVIDKLNGIYREAVLQRNQISNLEMQTTNITKSTD